MTISAEAPIGVIAHYNLLERLEPAGPGELYRARDTHVGRTVVLRVLPEPLTPDATAREAFLSAARQVKPLSHPNLIAVFDAGETGSRAYIAFEFLKGQSLRAEMAGRPMNLRRAVDLAGQMASGIADAHGSGLANCRISPESVVVTAKGLAKIPVFELATRDGFEQVEGVEQLRHYDSPEALKGAATDERSDVYSVGAVLYEMLTARRPSPKGAAAPSATNPAVPRAVDGVVLQAIAPNPARRFQSAVTFASALREAAAAEPRAQEASYVSTDAPRPGVGMRVVLAVGLLLAVVAAFALLR